MKNKKRKQEKFNKKTRCPWCGNVLVNRKPLYTGKSNAIKKCTKCEGYSEAEDKVTDCVYDMIMFAVVFACMDLYKKVPYVNVYAVLLLGFVMLCRYYFFDICVPYKRIKGYKEKGRKMPSTESLTEQILFYAHITWNCSKWRIFKFWSSKLLIIIAVDENNQPISHPLCVRIRKCKTGYELTKIMRILKFDKKACKRFFVYWGDELVGEGTVISKFYL